MIRRHTAAMTFQPLPHEQKPAPDWGDVSVRQVLEGLHRNAAQILDDQKFKRMWTFDESPRHKDSVKLKIYGVPASVKPVEALGVWRHYTSELNAILQQRVLRSTRNPYVRSEHDRYRETYPSLYGVFVTTRQPPHAHIGVHDSNPFIDFEMSPETPLLFLSEGIFLIPAQEDVFELPIHIVGAGRYV